MKLPDAGRLQKLYDPDKVAACICVRPTLIKTIWQASAKQHIYIFAPPKFGKTSSALAWLKNMQCAKAWMNLSKNDNCPDIFFERLVLAFLSIQPDNNALIKRLCCIKISEIENARYIAEETIYCLLDDTAKSYIVLDGFANIANEELIRNFIKVVKLIPKNFTVIIIGRDQPHDLFSDLILRNLMSVINEDCLMF